MEAYRLLMPQAHTVLRPGGWLVVEIGFSIETAVRDLLRDWDEVLVAADLQGIPRVIAAKK
jgi:methylase of polypeptide subunit release factors